MGFLDDAISSNCIRLSEAAPYFASNDPDRDYDIRNGMRKITGKENERDLTPLEQQRMIEIAHWLYDSNPLAKRIIDLINSFVTGDGFNFTAKHPDVLQVLKDFWHDPINDWPLKQLDRFRQLSLYGEQLYPCFTRHSDGRVRLGYVDPANIEEIIPKTTNPEVVEWAITRTGYTVDNTIIPKKYSLIHLDEQPLSRTYGKLIWDAGPDGQTDGAFYFAINKPSNATRGRSDLVTIFDWLDLYDQFLFGQSERSTYLTDFVWDVEMAGATEEDLRKWRRENPMPRGAAMRVHNEKLKWNVIAPDLKSADVQTQANLIRNQILTSAGIPTHWIVEGGDVNRSVGVSMAGPVLKSLGHRQRYCKAIITKIFTFVIDQAVIAGKLKGLTREQLAFDVLSPSLTPSDMSALTITLLKVCQSIKLAEDQGWITHRTAAEVFLNFLSELGMQVATDDELAKVENLMPLSRMAQPQAPNGQQPPNGQLGTVPTIDPLGPPAGERERVDAEHLAQQLQDRAMSGMNETRKGNPA